MGKNVEILLKKFKKNAIKEFEQIKKNRKYPTPVNCPVSLFGTIESGCKETAYTRALAYLLDCNETHGFGNDIFVELCSCKEINFPVKSAEYDVNAELWNQDKNNRYDIRISGKRTKGTSNPDFLIAIEAKINAGFGNDQLERYDEDLKNKSKNLIKICLTKESLEKTDLPEKWISLTWKDVASLLWNAIEKKEDRPGYEYVRYYISSIYQDIYQNNVKYSDIYDFIDDYDPDLIKELQDCEIDFETLIKYPNTCTAVYWKTEEDSAFDVSYLDGCKKLALKESDLLEDFCDNKKPFSGSSLTTLFKYHWHQKEKFEMATWLHGEMDENYNEQLLLSLSTFTHSKSKIHALKNILKDEKLPPNKSWWEKDLLLFEEPVKTSGYFSESKIKELKEKLRCFYKKIKSKKDFK